MKRTLTIATLIAALTLGLSPAFAKEVPLKGTEGPDIRAKVEPKGTEGPDVRLVGKTMPKGVEGPDVR
jgi:hypothetical protein